MSSFYHYTKNAVKVRQLCCCLEELLAVKINIKYFSQLKSGIGYNMYIFCACNSFVPDIAALLEINSFSVPDVAALLELNSFSVPDVAALLKLTQFLLLLTCNN